MVRFFLFLLFVGKMGYTCAQLKQVSAGIFTGLTIPYTWDESINNDARYTERFLVKAAPIGLSFNLDYQGYGFLISPSLIRIGQNYHVINTAGGQVGLRKINMEYINVPLNLKLNVIDLSILKVSVVSGISFGYLLNGKETITHQSATLRFPAEVFPILPSDYSIQVDGVLTPPLDRAILLEKKDFNKIQLFAFFGFRAEWDFAKDWRLSFDALTNYGVLESRTNTYLRKVSAYQTLYDLPGTRREIFAYLNIGIARVIEISKGQEHKPRALRKLILNRKKRKA